MALAVLPGAARAGSVETALPPAIATNLQGLLRIDSERKAGDGCVALEDDLRDLRRAAPSAALACRRTVPAPPKEVTVQHGELALKLAMIGGDAWNIGGLRSALSIDHGFGWGPLAGWQAHADAFLDRLADGGASPVEERAHLALARGLPAGWNLLLGFESVARGALYPSGAVTRRSELAARLSRAFRLSPAGNEHSLSFKTAEQAQVDRLSGAQQRGLLTSFAYSHALDIGALAADAAYTRVETSGAGAQATARLQLKYSARF